jgi:hypothetical protein
MPWLCNYTEANTLVSLIIFISQIGDSTACAGGCVCAYVPVGCFNSWSANGVDSSAGLPMADSGIKLFRTELLKHDCWSLGIHKQETNNMLGVE